MAYVIGMCKMTIMLLSRRMAHIGGVSKHRDIINTLYNRTTRYTLIVLGCCWCCCHPIYMIGIRQCNMNGIIAVWAHRCERNTRRIITISSGRR